MALSENPAAVSALTDVPLSWRTQDIEQRLAFRGGRYTQVNTLLSFLCACILTVLFYVALIPLRGTWFADMFTDRGLVQYVTCLLSAWALAILFFKWRKLALQRRALSHYVVPTEPDFVLSSVTVDDVFSRIYATVDDPKQFVLFNRITIALSNLRNIGRVSDVDEILHSQADNDQAGMETSFALVQGFVWAIPVLGFIGTVLGLSQAVGGFGEVLGQSSETDELVGALRGVTGGLATAFETTLVALVAALTIQILYTFVRKSEEEFLDACSEYCVRYVVGRLRTMPFELGEE